MGSWQPRGPDKSFMWIRDALSKMSTGVRFLLYGYDTSLVGSRSCQTIADLALTLINTLKAGDWTLPTGKPLIFLAHSLGGVVLKQMFVMLAGSGARETEVLVKTKGVMFFGVPSQGMPIPDLLAILDTQPNKEALVASISDHSEFLPQLERQVAGLSYVRHMKLFWAYETQTTPTVRVVSGQYERSGPESLLVSKESATGGRHESDPTSTIQIDANHSDIAKLTPGHHMLPLIASKLNDIVHHKQPDGSSTPDIATTDDNPNLLSMEDAAHQLERLTMSSVGALMKQAPDPVLSPDFWDRQSIIRSLRPPDRESRLNQIDERAGHSFEWVFDRPSIGLTSWLNSGSGVFWIRGRPGSGKSTMMKFLHNDPRTHEAMEKWSDLGSPIHASFFFHHRGTATQKSFQGLIRSVLSQVMERERKAVEMILPIFQDRYRSLLKDRKLGTFQDDLSWLIRTSDLTIGPSFQQDLEEILGCELPRTRFREIVKKSSLSAGRDGSYWLQAESRAWMCKADLLNATKEEAWAISLDISNKEWDEESKFRFCASILGWRDAVNLPQKLQNFITRNPPRVAAHHFDENFGADPVGPEEKVANLASKVAMLSRRQLERDFLREFVESDQWTMPRLSSAFTSIVKQQQVDLDLCLFLDALDEYDGRLESVVEFLKDIVKEQRNSRTRIRVLFSSRPWNIFIQEFNKCPGFHIHNHTEDDMRELCAQNIVPNTPGWKEMV
ncbi:hypothetical protein B0T16DRAFT_243262 [Cercophora newfieldiana]|uniref:Nephrocystin 3-like N-terminal domain-containing protein n=1 Tax=Cercophora newfieldiana TaxID=92897 RepID=A0AA40CHT8_9PEZI|nr:hypothetical protein B0T16DRAFT_243262 [Cercophora newfieldiana]